MIEEFYLRFHGGKELTGVDVKVPRSVASSAEQAVELVATQKTGRMVPDGADTVQSDDEFWYVPVETGGFEKSLPSELHISSTIQKGTVTFSPFLLRYSCAKFSALLTASSSLSAVPVATTCLTLASVVSLSLTKKMNVGPGCSTAKRRCRDRLSIVATNR
jgi:hypothetical protein